ncbi:MAG: nucleotidyltransferase domain-containing protein [Ammonifex sp.]|jgi:predicted nucleotidyltransferase|nr:MAG: nucleotidyltransferase domain-containing protein [Ammonifex sp.]
MRSFVVEQSWNSVRVFWLDQDRLLEEIREAAMRVGEKDANVKKIILFGSLAERRAVPGSDADILIVLKREDGAFTDRIMRWADKFLLDFPVEVFPFTIEELNNPIAQEAMKKGIVLFERLN